MSGGLQAPALPFVAGQLPAFQFTKTDPTGTTQPNPGAERMNAAVASLGKTVAHYAYVSAAGPTDRGDHLHFDARSARLLGRRYAQAIQQLQRPARRTRP
ncbi:hypothetical protein E4631_21490 [Hymenobacter sp. UV11]|uniref:sialate O-acetylesterase n=1 Tax=Hymenobacter sp. UV11 TaxID=1849735 RepID=UPI00105D6500|nr:sialate O-acetylesterase [Hymenobacter sp. UV11]TDN38871.1 hypothetical protein A8B98_22180 [Hymenobacter sp. UV11]TFZ63860.1 hypothetical protein E4631_21490 [Hymenobacter sp. UV11]